IGTRIAQENLWSANPADQATRIAAMQAFEAKPFEERQAIFNAAMDAGLDAEGITDQATRDSWKQAMTQMALGGPGFPGENVDLNPYIIAGESGGRFAGGANRATSSALGYFQFLATNRDGSDYGHWGAYGTGNKADMTNPTGQV